MRNLLSAGFTRLWRCKALWFSCFFLAVEVITAIHTRYNDRVKLGVINYLDGGFFYYVVFLGVLIAVVTTLLLGTDYNDGTVRNKVVVGCKRRDIYLANLIVCSTAALIMCLSSIIPGLCVGIPLLGGFHMGVPRAVLFIAGTFSLALAYAAIFTLLAMLVTNRAISAVAAILLALALMALGVYVDSRLQAQPTIDGLVIRTTDEAGNIDWDNTVVEKEPTPLYIPEGPMRTFFDFLYDFTPGGQMMQYAAVCPKRPEMMIQYNAVIMIITTAIGVYLFKRKDLR